MNKHFITNNYKALSELLNCVNVGIYITDGKGNTLLVNDESCKTGGLTRNEVLGKNMRTLEEQGFVKDSVSLKTINSGGEVSLIQHLGDGGKVFVTGRPLYKDGKIEAVICTERDITETLNLRELLKEIDQDTKKYKHEIEYLRMQNIKLWGDLVAEDEASKKTAEKALRVARLDTTVLLRGESGTGKEVYANFIYQNSARVGKPFIKVNCAAIPANLMESEMFGYDGGAFTGADKKGKIGLFEMANHGTIFLDEIGDLPVHLQPKILRVLQEKEILRVGGEKTIPLDIRLIAATNRDLEKEIELGNFREDLYYRLNVIPIELSPIRGRKKDIRKLALHFINNFGIEYKIKKTISESAIEGLQEYEWPGNIRELENVVERLIISYDGDEITRHQVDIAIGSNVESPRESLHVSGKTMVQLLEEYEKAIIESMLETHKRPINVAKALDMPKATLSRKMKKYGLR